MDDEEGIIDEVRIEPRLHDRWSLLALAVGFIDDTVKNISDYVGIAANMTAEHVVQKNYDKKFKEVTRGYSSERTGPVQSED